MPYSKETKNPGHSQRQLKRGRKEEWTNSQRRPRFQSSQRGMGVSFAFWSVLIHGVPGAWKEKVGLKGREGDEGEGKVKR